MKCIFKLLLTLIFTSFSYGFALKPPSLLNQAWEDYSLFKRDLVPAWQDLTESHKDLSIYHIKLELSDDLSFIKGQQEVLFTNTSQQALSDLVFRLYPNALGSQLDIARAEVNGVLALKRLEQQNTVLRIFLGRPLQAGEKLVVKLDFELQVRNSALGYGRLGRYEEVLSLAHGYPVLSVLDKGRWLDDFPSSEGDPGVTEAAFYLVQVDASIEETIIASGSLVDVFEEEQLQTLTFATGPVREFFLASAKGYQQLSRVIGDTVVHTYYPQRYGRAAELSLEVTANALTLFSEFFPYPYRELDLVAAPMQASGIEFPGVFTLSNRLVANPRDNLESVIVHETAHQWSYNLVGSDQVNEPWLDEALAQYLTLLYHQTYNSDAFVQGYLGFWQAIWDDAPDEMQGIGLAVSDYEGGAYSPIIYGRGLFFFKELADLIGQETLINALNNYYQSYAWQFAKAADLQMILQQTCDCDLAAFFKKWLDTSE